MGHESGEFMERAEVICVKVTEATYSGLFKNNGTEVVLFTFSFGEVKLQSLL